MTELVYKVIDAVTWNKAMKIGIFKGSSDDQRDGFIHLSTEYQVERVLGKFFKGQKDLLLIEIPLEVIVDDVEFEEATDGKLYPHIYGDLQTTSATNTYPLALDDKGNHILPFTIAQ